MTSTYKYIKSKDIKVFPCAYRGYYTQTEVPGGEVETTTLVFDPEARATTEANFINAYHKLSAKKESYIISWDGFILKCAIGGYYFEISNQAVNDFFYTPEGAHELQPYSLCIKLIDSPLSSSEDDPRTTKFLSSFEPEVLSEYYLDVLDNSNYFFTGLALVEGDVPTGISASLKPFRVRYKYTQEGIIKDNDTRRELLNSETHYYLYNATTGKYDRFTSESTITLTKTPYYTREESFSINPQAKAITELLDTDIGEYSIRILEGDSNTTVAAGDYSVALGKKTIANGFASAAVGNETTAIGSYSFVAGNNTKATGDGSVAFGSSSEASGSKAFSAGDFTKASGHLAAAFGGNSTASGEHSFTAGNSTLASGSGAVALGKGTRATEANQVVIGQYNKEDTSQAFIVANGQVNNKQTANKFTVSYDGDVEARGSFSLIGNKTEADPVFKVATTGDTQTYGTVHIKNSTISDSKTAGALVVSGGTGIGGKLSVGGGLDVASTVFLHNTLKVEKETILQDTLDVAGNTTLKGTLEVAQPVAVKSVVAASSSNAAFAVAGGANIDKNLNIGTTAVINGTDASTSKDTGALVVKGGAGFGKAIYVNGAVYTTEGVKVVGGGAEITGDTKMEKLDVSGGTAISNTAGSTSKDTGALIVSGGVGVGENLNVGAALNVGDKLDVGGNLTAKENLTVGGGLTVSKNLEVGSALNVTGTLVSVPVKLSVGGDGEFGKNITIVRQKKSSSDTSTSKLTLGGRSTDNPAGELQIFGALTDTVFSVKSSGNTEIAGTLAVDGITQINNDLYISKALNFGEAGQTSSLQISPDNGIVGLTGLTVAGTVEATSFYASSDSRLKCNVEEYKFEKSILDLPIKRFEYIKDAAHTKHIGCIAQELQEICPELVKEGSDGMLSIQESKLVYALIQEVKELKEKVVLLERR